MNLQGIVVVDKPIRRTSAQIVAEVRRRMGIERAGHTGTLDPIATGVLPVCVGEATKIAGWLIADDKAYDAELELGAATDTLDATGVIVREARAAAAAITEEQLAALLPQFTGAQAQVPPMHSAKRIPGRRRLYELARAGEEIERAPRAIVIHRLALVRFTPPRATIAIECSKGTYVRSLVDDLGRALGCGAHLTALRRTRSGPFQIAQALPIEALGPETPLIRPVDALALPRVVVPPALAPFVWHADAAALRTLTTPEAVPFLLVATDDRLLAVARREGDTLKFERVLRA